MRPTTRNSLAAVLFAGLAVMTLATAPVLAQPDRSTEPRTAAKKSRLPVEEEEAVTEEKARFQREQDKINEELYRQMSSMRQDVLRDTINRMRQGDRREKVIDYIIPFLVFIILLGSLLWLIRTILDNRRWNKIAAIQTDTHNKLLERMASSQELIAYMESEAGKRFLESTPFEIERAQSSGFPYGRILWSAQIGVVVLIVGVAFLWLQNQIPDAGQALLVFGTLSLALGVGCMLSAGFSYILSRSLGLVTAPRIER